MRKDKRVISEQRKNSLLLHGILNVTMHIPMIIVTSFWGLFIIGIFNLDSVTTLFWSVVCSFPIAIPLISCICGVIRGIIFIKSDKYAKFCLILSIIGIFLYAGMMYLCIWLGSIA